MTVWWLHLRTQSNVRGSFLLLRPQFWFHACPPHTFINLTGEKISICKKIWKVDPPPPYWKARRPWVRAWPVLWFFRAEKRSAQAFAHLLSQAQGGLFCVLTVLPDCVRLLLEFWVKCTRCERLLPVKHFYLTCLLFFRPLKITLDSKQPMLKEKRIIPSV